MGDRLKDIRVVPYDNDCGREEYLEIVFHTGDHLLRLVALPDTDEIHTEIIPVSDERELAPLPDSHWMRGLIGLKVGYIWTCTNSQGYNDMIVLSFDGLVPHLAVFCQCSTLRLLRMAEPPHGAVV